MDRDTVFRQYSAVVSQCYLWCYTVQYVFLLIINYMLIPLQRYRYRDTTAMTTRGKAHSEVIATNAALEAEV